MWHAVTASSSGHVRSPCGSLQPSGCAPCLISVEDTRCGRTTRVDDLTLLTTLARDLDTGFEALALAYQRRLYGLALRLTTSPPDGEEIAQDCGLVRADRALATYPTERIEALSLRPWLYQIAVNVWRNRVRKARLREVSLEGDDGATAFELRRPQRRHSRNGRRNPTNAGTNWARSSQRSRRDTASR